MALNEDDIRRIALDVAESIFGTTTGVALDVSAGPDWSGSFSYFLDFTLEQDCNRQAAMARRLRLRSDIRDRLVDAGDDTFPYVRVLNRFATAAGG